MLDLVNKSSAINNDDQEYNKMKERMWIINNNSLPENIFYPERFNVIKKNSFFLINFLKIFY